MRQRGRGAGRHSAIYEGWVRHRRSAPEVHEFAYRLFMMYLDLDELPELFGGHLLWSATRPAAAWFRRRDYLEPANLPLDEAVRRRVEAAGSPRPEGPIRVLTHLRYWGYGFNPVSFYYCFGHDGKRLEAIVVEITNTPWDERHAYVLVPGGDGAPERLCFSPRKVFHVSPFMPMDVGYRWSFTSPGSSLGVHMENHGPGGGGQPIFEASLALKRREIDSRSLAGVLLSYPLMTAKVSWGIYRQALGLWRKRIPFYPHPAKRQATIAEGRRR